MVIIQGSGSVTGVSVSAWSDGTDTQFSVALDQVPFSIDFSNNPPSALFVEQTTPWVIVNGQRDPSFTVVASINKSKLTISFNKPLPASSFQPGTSGNNPSASGTVAFGFSPA